jgi:hypothetical protein
MPPPCLIKLLTLLQLASTSSSACWSNIAYSASLDAYFTRHGIWNITSCAKAAGNCGYGSIYKAGAGCVTCTINAPNRIMAPVQPASAGCETMCAKGREAPDCRPCRQTEVLCDWGSYPSCGACVPCSTPSLPSSNYQYGSGVAYSDCAEVKDPDPSICAWFQTPQWGTGYCEVICADGYALGSASGECQRCKVQSECPLGWLAPICSATSAAATAAATECIKCTLPEGTRWYGNIGCNFTCLSPHHYYSTEASQCVPCPYCGEGQYPAGCGAPPQYAAGVCSPCSLSCPAGSFLQLVDCSCRECTTYFDMPSAYFINRDCTATADTVFAACSHECPAGFFKTGECQPRANIACERCSPPPPGVMTVSPCNSTHDAAFAQCPLDWIRLGYACRGGVRANCSVGQWPNEDGICACAPATVLRHANADCTPITCPPRHFANPATGGCTPCGSDENIVSVPQQLGIEASCGCEQGFFRRITAAAAVECWPCGDLACDALTQRQMPTCDRFDGEEEPACVCGPPPAAVIVDASRCTFECASGYTPARLSAPVPQAYISLVGFMIPTHIETFYLEPAGCEITVGVQGEMFCFQNVSNRLVHMRTGEIVAADIGQRLEIEHYRYDIHITAAAPAGGNTLWVAFSFSGDCGPDIGVSEQAPYTSGECGAVELITISLTSASISSAKWGKTFPWCVNCYV